MYINFYLEMVDDHYQTRPYANALSQCHSRRQNNINNVLHTLHWLIKLIMVMYTYANHFQLEFIRGLLQEVESKLLHDLPQIIHDDDLMAHSIDELLLFERELRTVYHYSHPSPSILRVMLDEVRFHKWLTLEKTCKLYVPVQ